MDIITIDFETFYSKEYGLGSNKLTTEEYIKSPEFEAILVAVKVNDGRTEWASGDNISMFLHRYNWAESAVLAHNTQFDGAILYWMYNIKPARYLDTYSMSRGINGGSTTVSNSLANQAKLYGLGQKGTEVVNALGKRRADFTADEMMDYAMYCMNDVDLTYKLFKKYMGMGFPVNELKLIDLTMQMYVNPILQVDCDGLFEHRNSLILEKENLLKEAGVESSVLMSNPKFAKELEKHNVTVPMKTSPTTGKPTYAFSKTDEEFLAMKTHPVREVRALVEARLGVKSTLEESRVTRLIGIGQRGSMPIPLQYYAARTGRWGGDEKINMQNLPSRGKNGGKIKRCIHAPDGYLLVDCDSSQIEARVLAWLACQLNLVNGFKAGEDVYVDMATKIYGKAHEDITKKERFMGKTLILGAGYGMGALKLQNHLKVTEGIDLSIGDAQALINVYRASNDKIREYWGLMDNLLDDMFRHRHSFFFNGRDIEYLDGVVNAVKLPSGMYLYYHGLRVENDGYVYGNGIKIYGGKLTENLCQAIARCVVAEQMLDIAKKYKVVLTVHDSVVVCVQEHQAEEAKRYMELCMTSQPAWAKYLPISCEATISKRYGGDDALQEPEKGQGL